MLRFSSDLLDHKFDRSYSYDHSARITEAFSGGEARGEGETTARPYKQTYSYDAFSHLTARTSLVWNYTVPATSDAYLNNRRTGWTYDANGNLLNGADGSYSFDAAGRIKEVGSFDPVSSTTRGLDGDGQQLRTVEVAYHKETSSWVTTIQYYMHSTVLGGQVLTELDSAGAKKRTFVYAGGTVLAWQKVMGTSQEVLWEHRDPSNASFRMVDMGGGIWGDPEVEPAELDPTGMNARTHAPFVNEPLREHGGSLLPYGSFVTFGNGLSRSYSVDRIPVPVEYFMSRLESQFQGALGFAEYLGRMSAPRLRNYEVALYNGRLNKDFGLNLNRAIGVALETNSTLIRNWLVNDWSFASTFFLPDPVTPQNSSRTPLTSGEVNTLLADLQKLLANPDCASFIKSALEQLKTDTGRSQHGTTDILGLFEAVKAGKGFDYRTMSRDQARGGGGPGTASISINPTNSFADLGNPSPGNVVNRGQTLIHELFHVAGYDHDVMAKAFFKMGEEFDGWKAWSGTFPDPEKDSFFNSRDKVNRLDGAYAGFFQNVLNQHCGL